MHAKRRNGAAGVQTFTAVRRGASATKNKSSVPDEIAYVDDAHKSAMMATTDDIVDRDRVEFAA